MRKQKVDEDDEDFEAIDMVQTDHQKMRYE